MTEQNQTGLQNAYLPLHINFGEGLSLNLLIPVKANPLDVTAKELIQQEAVAWEKFFGKEISIPEPPKTFLQTLREAHKLGFSTLEPHFLPNATLKQNREYPGWKFPPGKFFWKSIQKGKLTNDSCTLKESWVFIDNIQKPNTGLESGCQLYPDDPLGEILRELRERGKIPQSERWQHLVSPSRFEIPARIIQGVVIPHIAECFHINPLLGRLPKFIEFNILGNLHHPEWGNNASDEWFHDKFLFTSPIINLLARLLEKISPETSTQLGPFKYQLMGGYNCKNLIPSLSFYLDKLAQLRPPINGLSRTKFGLTCLPYHYTGFRFLAAFPSET